ncbi:MAG TPA: ATP-binding protein [Terriglobales bacterium]|nr:ATP-binding protein [Terriglobales bacterium]
MAMEIDHIAGEIKRLKTCINDLISVLALPAIWSGHEPAQIVSTLLDVLLGMLRLDFVYARLSDSIGGGAPIEMVRLAQGRNLAVQPQEIGHALNPWLTGDPRTSPLVMPNLLGEGTVSIAPLRLGLQNEVGVLVAGSKRADFPTEIEMLLLRVAANQAGIGLQEARLSIEQRLAAEWLERRVVERTRRHAAVNEELRKEIIERKRADAELRESERRYRYIFQSTGVSIWEEDFSQVKIAIDDLKARGVQDFRQYLATHPEFVQQAISMVKIIDVNDATVKLFEAQSKDELLVSLHKIFLPEAEEVFAGELIAIAEGRTNFESETVLQTLKGDKLAVLFTITFPRQPAKLNSVLVSIMDITERKQTEEELRKTQVELAHVTRVMTMGELAASIAHEVNQPLAAIVTNANACLRWLAGESPNLDEARETARHIVRDGNRAGDVIGRIRTLLRKTGTEKELLDMNQVIREVVALAEDEVRRNGVALRTELAGDLPLILGDRVELQQVVLNLIMNAIEAMSAIGDRPRDLVIRTQRGEVDQVRVTVQDSGIGLDPQCMGRIFDAFYTTKSQGMGMGLAISRSIIAAHGGRLWAVPNDGPGMTFEFALPVETASAI